MISKLAMRFAVLSLLAGVALVAAGCSKGLDPKITKPGGEPKAAIEEPMELPDALSPEAEFLEDEFARLDSKDDLSIPGEDAVDPTPGSPPGYDASAVINAKKGR